MIKLQQYLLELPPGLEPEPEMFKNSTITVDDDTIDKCVCVCVRACVCVIMMCVFYCYDNKNIFKKSTIPVDDGTIDKRIKKNIK